MGFSFYCFGGWLLAAPTVLVAGVDCNDPSGRWSMVDGTALLGSFPGRTEQNVGSAGGVGARVLRTAPLQPAKWNLRVRFYAVDPATGLRVRDHYDRAKSIAGNMRLFQSMTGLAAQGYQGHVAIERRPDGRPGGALVGYGRVVSVSEVEWDGYEEYVDVDYLFSIPEGRWFAKSWDITKVTPSALKHTTVKVPMGEAEIDDVQIAVKGPQDHSHHSIWVRNEAGVGFAYWGKTPADRWTVIGSKDWKATTGGINIPYWKALDNTQIFGRLTPWGESQGSALVLYPHKGNNYGLLTIRIPSRNQVQIRTRKAYYV